MQALEGLQQAVGNWHPQAQTVLWDLAGLLKALGRPDEAEVFARELLDATPEAHPERAERQQLLDDILVAPEASHPEAAKGSH